MSDEHYRALGISPDASKAEIRAAYKQRVKETHPDLNDDPNAAAEFQRVKAARDALLGSGATRSGPGTSASSGSSGTDRTGGSSSGSSSSGGRTETSGSGADSRTSRSDASSDGSDPRTNYSTRTEEPSGDYADESRGAGASSDRTSGGSSSTGPGASDRNRTDRSETTGGSSRSQRGTGSAASGSTSGDSTTSGSTDRRQETGAGAETGTAAETGNGAGTDGTHDYVRFRSVIEEPTGSRAASYDRVVSGQHTPARQGSTGTGAGTGTEAGTDASTIPMLLPAFLVVLVKQYIYSLKWALLGLPLTFIYLVGLRGLYFSGLQPSFLSYVLGAVGLSLVKARLGVNFSGTATIGLAYYVFVWFPSQPYGSVSLLEVGIAVHLLPLFVVTALIAEYK